MPFSMEQKLRDSTNISCQQFSMKKKNESIFIYIRNVQKLATEIYKVRKGLSLLPMGELFKSRDNDHYYIRHAPQVKISSLNTIHHGTGSTSFLGSKSWNFLPIKLKNTKHLKAFKPKIKKLEPWKWSVYNLLGL